METYLTVFLRGPDESSCIMDLAVKRLLELGNPQLSAAVLQCPTVGAVRDLVANVTLEALYDSALKLPSTAELDFVLSAARKRFPRALDQTA